MSRTRVSVLSPVVGLALLALEACAGEHAAERPRAVAGAPAPALVQVASAAVPNGGPDEGPGEGPDGASSGARAPAAPARAAPVDGRSPVAVPVAAPEDRVAYAGTLRELAWAAERAGDAEMAAEYREEADALAPAVPAAKAVATTAAASRAAVPRARRASAARRRTAGSAARRRATARGARPSSERTARPPVAEAPAARESRPAPAAPPPVAEPQPRRRVDRVFARVERWLGGRRRVDRSGP